jgi:hypothetical protein
MMTGGGIAADGLNHALKQKKPKRDVVKPDLITL